MGLFGLTTYILSQISHKTISFWILEAVLLWKIICLGVQSHPEDQGDFGQDLIVNI